MSLKSLIDTGTKVWLDGMGPQHIKSNRALGITGATSNPTIISHIIEKGDFVMTKYRIGLEGLTPAGLVRLTISKESTSGDSDNRIMTFKPKSDLAKLLNDPNSRGFRIVDITGDGDSLAVTFANEVTVDLNVTAGRGR